MYKIEENANWKHKWSLVVSDILSCLLTICVFFSDSQSKKVNNGHQKRAGLLSSALQSVQKRFEKDPVGSYEVRTPTLF